MPSIFGYQWVNRADFTSSALDIECDVPFERLERRERLNIEKIPTDNLRDDLLSSSVWSAIFQQWLPP